MITCGSEAMAKPLLLALLPIANDRMRGAVSEKEYDDALREGVRRRTAKTLRPTHMRPPMAVPASVDNEEPPWPDLRNMESQEGFSLYRACSKVAWMSAARARRLRPRKSRESVLLWGCGKSSCWPSFLRYHVPRLGVAASMATAICAPSGSPCASSAAGSIAQYVV